MTIVVEMNACYVRGEIREVVEWAPDAGDAAGGHREYDPEEGHHPPLFDDGKVQQPETTKECRRCRGYGSKLYQIVESAMIGRHSYYSLK